MNLYIQVENGQCINHPAFESNLIEAFGAVPDNWEPFIRFKPELPSKYHVFTSDQPTYQKIDGVWTDVWEIRELTPEEKIQLDATLLAGKKAAIQDIWARRKYASNFSAWVFNEEKLKYEPPIPCPNDGKFYRWSGPDNNWKEAEPVPNDGKNYEFDFDNWVNVEITNV